MVQGRIRRLLARKHLGGVSSAEIVIASGAFHARNIGNIYQKQTFVSSGGHVDALVMVDAEQEAGVLRPSIRHSPTDYVGTKNLSKSLSDILAEHGMIIFVA